jgi:hypothetical protein
MFPETSVDFQRTTRRYVVEDRTLQVYEYIITNGSKCNTYRQKMGLLNEVAEGTIICRVKSRSRRIASH